MIAPWLLYASAMGIAIVIVALLLERVARWRTAPTRWIWLAAIVVIVALPVILNFAIRAPIVVASDLRAGSLATVATPRQPQQPAFNIDRPLLALWLIASVIMAVRVLGAAMALHRRRKSWIAATLGGTDVLLADNLGPAVIGWTKLTTVLPRWAFTLDEGSRAIMLEHEMEHRRSGDPYLRTVAVAAIVLMPWNPAIWWTMRRLRLAVEIDCDQRLLAAGVDRHAYASLLLAVGERIAATPFAWATALVGTRSSLEKRIIAMTSPFRPRRPRLAVAAVLALVGAIVIVACQAELPDPVVSPKDGVAVTQHSRALPAMDSNLIADTMELVCAKGSECHGDTVAHKYIQYHRRAPRDTVYVDFNGEIPSTISMDFEAACENDPRCAGLIGEGHRNDTVFVFRKDNARLHSVTGSGFVDYPSVKLDSIKPEYDVQGHRAYRGRPDSPVDSVVSTAYCSTQDGCGAATSMAADLHRAFRVLDDRLAAIRSDAAKCDPEKGVGPSRRCP